MVAKTPPTLTPSTANLAVNTCVGVPDPNGGPLLSMPPEWNRQRQLIGLWYDPGKFPGVAGDALNFLMQQTPPDLDEYGDLLYAHAMSPTWWTVDLYGIELARFIPAGDPPVTPADQSFLISNGQRFTRLKARVSWENMQVPREVDIDIGTGTRFSILANNLRIKLLIPKGQRFQEVGTVVNTVRSDGLQFGPGLVLDAMVGASVYPCFAPLSNRYPTFTQRIAQLSAVDVPPGVFPIEIPTPPAAKYLSIYPTGDPFLIPWTWQSVLGQAVAGAVPFGTIDYDPAISAVVRRPVPQNVGSIIQPVVGFTRRGWDLTWELEL